MPAAYDAERIAARMRQILGAPQKIAPLATHELGADQVALIREVRAGIGLKTEGELPEYFRVAVKNPGVFRAQLQTGAALFTGTIPPRERELAVLRLAWLILCPYEWGEHVRIARREGVTAVEIERCIAGGDAPGWSAHEAAILRGVDELLADQMIADATWDTLAASWSEAQLLEYPLLVGSYLAVAFVQNSIRMRLGPGNEGLGMR